MTKLFTLAIESNEEFDLFNRRDKITEFDLAGPDLELNEDHLDAH
jgi:hypothetical protein